MSHLETMRKIAALASEASILTRVDADLALEAGMNGSLARLLQAARNLDASADTRLLIGAPGHDEVGVVTVSTEDDYPRGTVRVFVDAPGECAGLNITEAAFRELCVDGLAWLDAHGEDGR